MSWIGASAKEAARAVRRGDVSATQVVADHLEHIRRLNPRLQALRVVREGEAAAEAEQVDQQEDLSGATLAGVPVAVKENTPVAGLPTWWGSAAAAGPVADRDHEVVRRLRGAGAVVVGTSRMPELGLWGTTDEPVRDPSDGRESVVITRSPWHRDFTPGGSSGGAAAAVAAGLVPMAHGSDGLGSVRIPAACCGLVGLKPGRGVVPRHLGVDGWFELIEHGMLTTTVADAAVGFAVLAGQRPTRLDEPSRVRIAMSLRSPVRGVRPNLANRQAAAAAARLLAAAGHDLIRAELSYPTWLGPRGLATWFAAAHRDADHAGLDRSTLQPRTRRHLALGERSWRRGLVRTSDRERWRDLALGFLESYDVLLTPALAGPPPAAAAWSTRSWQANLLTNLRFAPYAAPWNIAGLPAIVVPVGAGADRGSGHRDAGLPLAVQLVGPPGSERLLLGLAGQLEEAAPWARHAPPATAAPVARS